MVHCAYAMSSFFVDQITHNFDPNLPTSYSHPTQTPSLFFFPSSIRHLLYSSPSTSTYAIADRRRQDILDLPCLLSPHLNIGHPPPPRHKDGLPLLSPSPIWKGVTHRTTLDLAGQPSSTGNQSDELP